MTMTGIDDERNLPPKGRLRFNARGTRVQCHVCGAWRLQLYGHIEAHGYDPEGYRSAFELPPGQLVAPRKNAKREVQRAGGSVNPASGPGSRGYLYGSGESPRQGIGLTATGAGSFDRERGMVTCRVCGRSFPESVPRRHLRSHDLTREEYRRRYLPDKRRGERWRMRISEEERAAAQLEGMPPVHGTLGVMAYDPVDEKIQCHYCGRWLQAITGSHLHPHGLTVPEYKEVYGLNQGTALAVPAVREKLRVSAIKHDMGRRLIGGDNPAARAGRRRDAKRLEALRRWGWSTERVIEALKRLQAEKGGHVLANDLTGRSRNDYPSLATVQSRLGSWENACRILGQPSGYAAMGTEEERDLRMASDGEIVERLCRLELATGVRMSGSALRRMRRTEGRGIPSYHYVIRRFESWSRVRELMDQAVGPAGPAKAPQRRPTRRTATGETVRVKHSVEEVLAGLSRLREYLGRDLTYSDVRQRTLFRFGCRAHRLWSASWVHGSGPASCWTCPMRRARQRHAGRSGQTGRCWLRSGGCELPWVKPD